MSEQAGSLVIRLKHFHPDMTGWEEKQQTVDFPLVAKSATTVQFSGMTFVRAGEDAVTVYLAIGEKKGTPREETFRYRRVARLGAARAANATELELKQVVREMFDAFGRGDTTALDRILADTLLDTNPDGHTATKAQLLADVLPLPPGIQVTLDIEDARVQEYGDVAVMSYTMVFSEEIYGRPIRIRRRVTETYRRREDRWVVIARQETLVPGERMPASVNASVYDQYVGEYRLTPALVLTVRATAIG